MRWSVPALLLLLGCAVLHVPPAMAQPAPTAGLRVIVFGAHPNDMGARAGGVAALWAAQGHAVKFVSLTNGNVGHFGMAGGPLAIRRQGELAECARILGVEAEILDIHDGELMPTLENRKTVVRLIREWQADVVLAPRRYESHADLRNAGILVDDAAVLVVAPFYTPDTPPLPRNPVILYYSDTVERPLPFEPTMIVPVDGGADRKWACLSAMPSMYGDADSWQASTRTDVPAGDPQRLDFLVGLVRQRTATVAELYRDRLVELFGPDRARQVRYAEAFELSEYGAQPTVERLKQLFPTD
jgi:N-acetylglucosamine malate deacetylase 1